MEPLVQALKLGNRHPRASAARIDQLAVWRAFPVGFAGISDPIFQAGVWWKLLRVV
jgi:hypothetical protein